MAFQSLPPSARRPNTARLRRCGTSSAWSRGAWTLKIAEAAASKKRWLNCGFAVGVVGSVPEEDPRFSALVLEEI